MVLYQGRSYKAYRGMGSVEAMSGFFDRYFQDGAGRRQARPRRYRQSCSLQGALKDTVYQLMGGLRATMGTPEVRTLKPCRRMHDLFAPASAGLRESRPRRDHHP